MLRSSWHLQCQKYDADSEMWLPSSGVVRGCHEGVEKTSSHVLFSLLSASESSTSFGEGIPNGRH
jgi:hypothetical protein